MLCSLINGSFLLSLRKAVVRAERPDLESDPLDGDALEASITRIRDEPGLEFGCRESLKGHAFHTYTLTSADGSVGFGCSLAVAAASTPRHHRRRALHRRQAEGGLRFRRRKRRPRQDHVQYDRRARGRRHGVVLGLINRGGGERAESERVWPVAS